MQCQCPYPNCSENLPSHQAGCPKCGKPFKVCKSALCREVNRRFSRFCRSCGSPMPETDHDWTMFRGGIQRTGLSKMSLKLDFNALDSQTPLKELAAFQLNGPCHSLLFSEGRLIALSAEGEVFAADVLGDKATEVARFSLGGKVHAEPAIAGGLLFAAADNQVMAYAIGGGVDGFMREEPYWKMSLTGQVHHSLLAIGDSLYCITDGGEGAELIAFDKIFTPSPKQIRLHSAKVFSPLAGKVTDQGHKIYFVSPEQGGTLYEIDHADGGEHVKTGRSLVMLNGYSLGTPICVVGDMLFGIFGERKRLCRVKISLGQPLETRGDDVEHFAYAEMKKSILVSSSMIRDTDIDKVGLLDPGESYRGMPVIIKDFAVAVSLNYGKVRLYDLKNLTHSRNWQVGGSRSDVTAAAPAGHLSGGGAPGHGPHG